MVFSSSTSSDQSAGPSSRPDQSSSQAGTWKAALISVRDKGAEVQKTIKQGIGEANLAPEEGHAGQLSAAKQAAVEQLKARRRAMVWMKTGEDEDEERRGGIAGFFQARENEVEEDEEEEESAVSTAFLVSYFIAGGAAGATSRTVVSPLERLKIIMQVQPKSASGSKGAYSGVISGLQKMWHEEGFKGFMRGNGINCLRIAPYSAVQFSTYEILKNALKDPDGELDVPRRLGAGAVAGIASVVSSECRGRGKAR